MIALVVLMAQIGSHVPAQSVRMGLHDSILTRMGGKLFEVSYRTGSHW